MIDWLTVKVPLRHPVPLAGGQTVVFNEDGTIRHRRVHSQVVEGSHSAKLLLRTVDDRAETGHFQTVEFTGNPMKFLQGHNLWGSNDLRPLLAHAFVRAISHIGMQFCTSDVERIMAGDFRISRVDVAENFTLATPFDVKAWIRAASERASVKYRGRGNVYGNTSLYFGQGSKRWSFKFYDKGEELLKNPDALRGSLPARPELLKYSSTLLRGELTMRGKELERFGLHVGSGWTGDSAEKLFGKVLGNIMVGDKMHLEASTLGDIPAHLRACYSLWEKGVDVRSIYSRASYYRHRKALLGHGIDIAASRVGTSNVVPLVRVLQAEPAQVPAWAFEKGLVYQWPLAA